MRAARVKVCGISILALAGAANNQVTGFASGGAMTSSFTYNQRLQPVNMSADAASQAVFSIGYDFHVGKGTSGTNNVRTVGVLSAQTSSLKSWNLRQLVLWPRGKVVAPPRSLSETKQCLTLISQYERKRPVCPRFSQNKKEKKPDSSAQAPTPEPKRKREND